MKRLNSLLAAALGLGLSLALSAPARAEPIDIIAALDAPVEFKADYALTEGDQTWNGTVVHAPNRERRDFTTSIGTQALLLRRDTDQAAIMWPQRKFYMSTSLKALVQLGGNSKDLALDRHHDGIEIIGGEPCVRYTVVGAFKGRMWYTKDGILIRARGTVEMNGHERTISTQLTHIQRGGVDADSFELPLGYHGFPVSPSLLGAGSSE